MLHTPQENDAFWQSERLHLALAPGEAAPGGLAEIAQTRTDTAGLCYFKTSGSEGVPKWVGLSREGMLTSARAVNEHLESASQDRWLVALPTHHVGGCSILARCHASRAAWSFLEGKWDAVRFADQCAAEGIALVSLVPTQVYDLVASRLPAPDTLRAIVVGGGGMNREVALRALELGWPVLQSFGMTETASQIATEPLEHLRAGFDPDSLEVLSCWQLGTDETDRLTVRGSALAKGYMVLREGAWQWEPIDAEAGLATRDRVQIWHHGARQFLRFLGREASFVKVLGELVSLPELQARLEKICLETGLAPASCVIWPVADERQETRLMMIGEVDARRLEELRVQFNEGVPGYRRLSEVRGVAAIPRTGLGKVDRVRLEVLLRQDCP
ncbi:AMP-binding protein [Verrucomicrobium sp. BvORR034]|uniref:AMP-binding protein n=1 Tax=Verrucomicrobium sp. BvORR034 TaxID=1396418 RepID=UPI0006785896|nr:AMP-binding protein [Verrucomicrobium sp. BvORR034]